MDCIFPLPISLTQSRVLGLGPGVPPPIFVIFPEREQESEELSSPGGVMGTPRSTATTAFATEQEPLSWANRNASLLTPRPSPGCSCLLPPPSYWPREGHLTAHQSGCGSWHLAGRAGWQVGPGSTDRPVQEATAHKEGEGRRLLPK